jgi:hypothetical protein
MQELTTALDFNQLHLLVCLRHTTRTSKTALWTTSAHRDRATLRTSLVVCHGDMSINDHIPRFIWRLVHGDVFQPTGRQGMGLDW